MIESPLLWGIMVVVLSAALIALMVQTLWPRQNFRPSRLQRSGVTLPQRLQEITRHRARKLQALPVEELLRLPAQQTEKAATPDGHPIVLRTQRNTLPDGRIQVWVETGDGTLLSTVKPVRQVVILPPPPPGLVNSETTGIS